ncbi:MAG: flagellar basal body L-ring protein FlgH [Syntrophales bacterium]|nr:flagellar basal body L-ring protein FlgH [Syntrophales bacterium]
MVVSYIQDVAKNGNLRGILAILLLLIFSAGCAQHHEIVKKEIPVLVGSEEAVSQSPGSLWTGERSANMLFVDTKARYEGDVITVLINESSSGQNSADTKTSKDTSAKAGVASLLGLEQSVLSRNSNMGTQIGLEGSSASSLKGSGNTSRDGELVARITARVSRVLKNGNLFIEGTRQLTVNAEEQYITISGIVRPEDITSDNLVSSQYIADARILYTGRGVINDKMRPGWGTRILDWAWPF